MKVSLLEVRKMGIFEEIPPPPVVYHMTDRKNLEAILRDGKIKPIARPGQSPDYMTFFFPSLEEIPVYIQLTGADKGREYYDFDGRLHTAAPLNHEETVVLELTPRGRQEMEWYKEIMGRNEKDEATRALCQYMNDARVCHYGAMPFEKSPKIMELSEVDKMPKIKKLEEVKKLQDKVKTD